VILNIITEKLMRRSKDYFKGRHFEARLIVPAVTGICVLRSATETVRKCSKSAA
jgi:hypothetical protein